jgi:hypothetical protein
VKRLLTYLPLAVTVAAGALLLAHGPIPQLAHYHEFADQSSLTGVPHAADVLSNLGFGLVAAWGMLRLWTMRNAGSYGCSWPACCSLWQSIYGAPRRDRIAFGCALALYLVAKFTELADYQMLAALGVVSGHTLKHLLATAAAAVIVARLVERQPAPQALPLLRVTP